MRVCVCSACVWRGRVEHMCVARGRDWLAGAKKKKNNQRLVATFRPQTVDTGRSTWAIRKTAARNQIDKKQALHTAGGRRWLGAWQSAGVRQGLDSTRLAANGEM